MSEEKSKPEPEKKEKKKEQPREEAKTEQQKPAREIPPEPKFAHLVETFAVQALIYLGKIVNPITNKYEQDLAMARYQIGILEILEAKSKGNRTPDEDKLLADLLHTARLAYTDVTKNVSGDETGKGSSE